MLAPGWKMIGWANGLLAREEPHHDKIRMDDGYQNLLAPAETEDAFDAFQATSFKKRNS